MTDLIEVKAADLTGEALGWAVGKAEGLELELAGPSGYITFYRVLRRRGGKASWVYERYNPWENWALGGPLIDKHRVWLEPPVASFKYEALIYGADGALAAYSGQCDSSLIATCRAIVAAKLGDTVKVPKVLLP